MVISLSSDVINDFVYSELFLHKCVKNLFYWENPSRCVTSTWLWHRLVLDRHSVIRHWTTVISQGGCLIMPWMKATISTLSEAFHLRGSAVYILVECNKEPQWRVISAEVWAQSQLNSVTTLFRSVWFQKKLQQSSTPEKLKPQNIFWDSWL